MEGGRLLFGFTFSSAKYLKEENIMVAIFPLMREQ